VKKEVTLEKYSLTMRDIKRHEIINSWLKREIRGNQVSTLLGVSYRHALRLKRAFKEKGLEGIIPKKRGGRKGISNLLRERVTDLFKGKYDRRFNIAHFKEKLDEIEDIHLSYSLVRNILIEKGLHKPKKRKGDSVYRRRKRMPIEGMLLQMDSSLHRWLEHIPEEWYLITMIDDATNELLFAKFFHKDTAFNNMEVIRKVIENKGLFMSLYVDKASHFKTTRYGGLHYEVSIEHEETHIEKILKDLGITLIPANSPQAKGRIERDFGTLQDRLINEMWLTKIKDYKEANIFLKGVFISYWNKRFKQKPRLEGSVYKSTFGINLDLVFTKRYVRCVSNDSTISFYNQEILLPLTRRKLNPARKEVEVRLSSEGTIWILNEGRVIHRTKISEGNSLIKKEKLIENILKNRSYG
jgi:transposase